ncbi:MAG: hypothetical protein LIP15_10245 [Clostridium sp.]|nr:hypothetical protein [Clostridium sp.]
MNKRFKVLFLSFVLTFAFSFNALADTRYDDDWIALFLIGMEERLTDEIQSISVSSPDIDLSDIEGYLDYICDYLTMTLYPSVRSIGLNVDGIYLNAQLQYQLLESISGVVTNIKTNVSTINTNVSFIELCVDNIFTRLGTMNTTLSNIYTRLGTMSTTLSNVYSRLGETNEKIDTISSKLDNLTNGFDSSGMDSETDKFGTAADEYSKAESDAMRDSQKYISDFEIPSFSFGASIVNALNFIGSIMQELFTSMGSFNIPITVSLTFTFVTMLLGYHRFRN